MCFTIEEDKRKTFKLEVTLIHYIIETKSHFYIFIIYSSSSSISCEGDYLNHSVKRVLFFQLVQPMEYFFTTVLKFYWPVVYSIYRLWSQESSQKKLKIWVQYMEVNENDLFMMKEHICLGLSLNKSVQSFRL